MAVPWIPRSLRSLGRPLRRAIGKDRQMKYTLTAVTFLVSFAVIGVVSFFFVVFLAGLHADLLPEPLEVVVAIVGWLSVLVIPLLVARLVWKRMAAKSVA